MTFFSKETETMICTYSVWITAVVQQDLQNIAVITACRLMDWQCSIIIMQLCTRSFLKKHLNNIYVTFLTGQQQWCEKISILNIRISTKLQKLTNCFIKTITLCDLRWVAGSLYPQYCWREEV